MKKHLEEKELQKGPQSFYFVMSSVCLSAIHPKEKK
jgi:hypothetical protein